MCVVCVQHHENQQSSAYTCTYYMYMCGCIGVGGVGGVGIKHKNCAVSYLCPRYPQLWVYLECVCASQR